METIAIILFIVLCPCISYIAVKRWLIPWSGGICFVMGDDSLVSVDWSKDNWDKTTFPTTAVIKGVFLPGAKANMMPNVSFTKLLRDENASLTNEMVSYQQIETSAGVYQIYCDPMDGKRFNLFMLAVFASYPWKGWGRFTNKSGYFAYIQVRFTDDKKK